MTAGLTKLIETVYGPLEQKRRWWRYKARKERLPASYRTAVDALQRYSYYFGGGTAEGGLSMMEDLADLFEQGAIALRELPIAGAIREMAFIGGIGQRYISLFFGDVDQRLQRIMAVV